MQEQQQLIEQQQQQQQISISMPSLDDNGDNGDSQTSAHAEGIPMELEEMQNAEDGQQIKFILNEDGQLLQLDNNHIITTDADGNQILVQGGDSDQIQQLLQSVVMQSELFGDLTSQLTL
jgi:zinc finger protein 423